MAVSEEQIAHALELLDGVGPMTTRKMFGGLGIYADGKIFAILMSDGVLKLKGAGPMAHTFHTEGWERWTYQRDGSASKPPCHTGPCRMRCLTTRRQPPTGHGALWLNSEPWRAN